MLNMVGVNLSKKPFKEDELVSLSLLDQMVWRRGGQGGQTSKSLSFTIPSGLKKVGKEIKVVSFGL